jgi:hypothetical protein
MTLTVSASRFPIGNVVITRSALGILIQTMYCDAWFATWRRLG